MFLVRLSLLCFLPSCAPLPPPPPSLRLIIFCICSFVSFLLSVYTGEISSSINLPLSVIVHRFLYISLTCLSLNCLQLTLLSLLIPVHSAPFASPTSSDPPSATILLLLLLLHLLLLLLLLLLLPLMLLLLLQL